MEVGGIVEWSNMQFIVKDQVQASSANISSQAYWRLRSSFGIFSLGFILCVLGTLSSISYTHTYLVSMYIYSYIYTCMVLGFYVLNTFAK